VLIRPTRRRLLTGAAALAAYGRLGRAEAAPIPTTWNPSDTTATLSNGNLTATTSGGGTQLGCRTIFSASAGKFYFEFWGANLTSGGGYTSIGLSSAGVSFANIQNHGAGVFGWYATGGVYQLGTLQSTIDTFGSSNSASASACQVALDFTNRLAWFRNQSHGSNTNWNANAANNPATGTGGISFSSLGSPPWFAYCAPTPNNGTISFTVNFGASAFQYAAPSGFQAGFGLVPVAGGQDMALTGVQ
jgi:hypothetical protein